MDRILLTRKRDSKLENKILKLLNVNSSGMIIYDGKGRESDRTGSPAKMLIDYFLYKHGTKPLDYDIFLALLKKLKIEAG